MMKVFDKFSVLALLLLVVWFLFPSIAFGVKILFDGEVYYTVYRPESLSPTGRVPYYTFGAYGLSALLTNIAWLAIALLICPFKWFNNWIEYVDKQYFK